MGKIPTSPRIALINISPRRESRRGGLRMRCFALIYKLAPRNDICGQLPRLSLEVGSAYSASMGPHLIDVLHTCQLIPAERLRPPIVNTPARSAREGEVDYAVRRKGIVRDIPAAVLVNANFPSRGICADAWVGPLRLLNAAGIHPSRFPRPSESAFVGRSSGGAGAV